MRGIPIGRCEAGKLRLGSESARPHFQESHAGTTSLQFSHKWVLKELQADGTYRVTTRSNCDAVLVGQISEIRKSQLRADRQDTLQSEELNLFLYVDFHLEDPITGLRIGELKNQEKGENVSWQDEKSGSGQSSIKARNGRVVGEVIQFIDESFQVGERNDLAFAAEDLADKLVSQLANGW